MASAIFEDVGAHWASHNASGGRHPTRGFRGDKPFCTRGVLAQAVRYIALPLGYNRSMEARWRLCVAPMMDR
jgi:hypothetical protein